MADGTRRSSAAEVDPAPETAPDGQTRRRLESRRRLLDGAQDLFVERGYDRTRPQDIARHAGVATGTFYLHFKDKEDVFLAFADRAQTRMLDDCAAALEGVAGVTRRLRVFIRTMLDHAAAHPGVLQVAFLDPVMIAPGDEDAWRIYDRFSHLFAEGLAEAAEHEAIHTDYDLDLVAHAIGGFMRHGTIFGGRREMDLDEVTDQITRFIGRGLGAAFDE
jgi:AcrR family transcriptional regulator